MIGICEDLRKSVLQAAIQGKLTKQLPEDGNAEDLYRDIQKEKQRLIKEGKIKKEKPLSEITDDDIPFDIPENWKWVRLKEIVYNNGQMTPFEPFSYIDIGSIDNIHQKLNPTETILEPNKAPSRARKIVKQGDILYSTVRPYLHNMCIVDRSFSHTPIASTGFAVMSCFKGIDNRFLFYYLLSPDFDAYANATDNAKGVAYPAINDDKLYKAIIPLPPLAEQKRIVARVDELMKRIDEMEKTEKDITALYEAFPGDMKAALLQAAIQGKLTEQLASDGDAETLYADIQKEKQRLIKEGKIKKEKPLSEITEYDIPFDIPENWKWVKLRNICTKIVDGDHNPPKGELSKSDYLMLSSQNINNDRLVDLDRCRYLSKEKFEVENQRTNVSVGDILLTTVATLGRSCIFNGGVNVCFQRSVSVVTTVIYNHYLKAVFDSPYFQNLMVTESAGTAQKGFYLNQLSESIIPVPPLAEQKRIVEKLDQLLPLCDAIRKNISGGEIV